MKVLLIDDDASLAGSLTRLLEAGDGVHVHYASCGGAALNAFLDDGPFDLVLCDWDLGVHDTLNGGEIVQLLIDADMDPPPRFVIMSGVDRDVPEGVEFRSKADLDAITSLTDTPPS